jgi:diacylglycerol kinase
MNNRPFRERMGFAIAGLRECWRTEASFRSHIGLGSLAGIAMLIIRPAPVWWALVGLVVSWSWRLR